MTRTQPSDLELFARPEREEPCHLCGKDRCEVIWMGFPTHVRCAQKEANSPTYATSGCFTGKYHPT